MRIYYDAEFIERGPNCPIELISIGMVREDGRELYGVLADGWDESHCDEWLRTNVLPYLGPVRRVTRADLAVRVVKFCGSAPKLWGYYSSYDHVVLCQLFGRMIDLPDGWPMFTRDVKQLAVELGNPRLPRQEFGAHNALADARHVKVMHEFLMRLRDV